MHEMWMNRALTLATKGWGATNPNPLVGAVVVKNGQLVGEGYHKAYGQPHAEVMALQEAGKEAQGASLYVTLEPCNHYGKTPPCTNAIINAGITCVYVAVKDPNPVVAGSGLNRLKEAGIEVHQGLLEQAGSDLNDIFIHYISTMTPYVIYKAAMSLDGKTASNLGKSQWISCEESRKHVHWMRQRVGGIMVGVGTILQDNPSLTVRDINDPPLHPLRIIADTQGRIPLTAKVLNDDSGAKTLIATTEFMPQETEKALEAKGTRVLRLPSENGKVPLKPLMKEVASMGIDSILLEGGGTLASAALENDIINQLMIFIAPKLIGGATAPGLILGKGIDTMGDALPLENMTASTSGKDILITAKIKKK